jgi:hypothetical protein
METTMNNNSSLGKLMIIALGVVGGGAAVFFLGNRVFWQPYVKVQTRLEGLEKDVGDKENDLLLFNAERKNLEKWSKLSLPNDVARAQADYGHNTLHPMFVANGLVVEKFEAQKQQIATGGPNQKKSRHIILPFEVKAHGTVDALTKSLKALQQLPVMHRVKKLEVDRAEIAGGGKKDSTGNLNVTMLIDAMIVAGANNDLKLDDPSKYKKIETDRAYTQVALRNPFTGPVVPPKKQQIVKKDEEEIFGGPNIIDYVILTSTSVTNEEAWLRNKILETKPIRVRPQPGFDTFKVFADEDYKKPIFRAKVLRVDDRAIHFQVLDDVYTLGFYQTLGDAMLKKLPEQTIKELDLTSKIDPEFAKNDEINKKRVSGGPPGGPGFPGGNKTPNLKAPGGKGGGQSKKGRPPA